MTEAVIVAAVGEYLREQLLASNGPGALGQVPVQLLSHPRSISRRPRRRDRGC